VDPKRLGYLAFFSLLDALDGSGGAASDNADGHPASVSVEASSSSAVLNPISGRSKGLRLSLVCRLVADFSPDALL
jgi:hypothetical protein